MTNHYDEMRVSPDPVKTEELRQRLQARMANTSTDDHRGRSALHLDSDLLEPERGIAPMTELSPPDTSTTNQRTHRRRAMVAAAAIVVAIAAAGIAIKIEDRTRVATTSPTTSAANTTTEQYASTVSEHTAAIQAWIESEDSCDHVECSIWRYMRERYIELRTLLVNFDQALAELPSPPDEIATLVDTTKTQVNDTVNSIELMLTCHVASPDSSLACGDEQSEAEAAYKRLPPMFASWSPYT